MGCSEAVVVSHCDQLPAPFVQPFAYWESRRGADWAPAWSNFRLEELNPKVLPWSVVVDVLPDDFYYRFWGSERAKLIGLELSRKMISEIPQEAMREANVQEYRHVAAIKVPVLFDTLIAQRNGVVVWFQSLRLPLSDDGKSVTKIFSALNYAQVNKAHYEAMAAILAESQPSYAFR